MSEVREMAESTSMKIVADDREPAELLAALRSLPSADVSVARLPLGDFLVEDQFLVERKTLRDFAVSVWMGGSSLKPRDSLAVRNEAW